jgi:hypothetical protein
VEAERTWAMLVRLYAGEDGQSHFEDRDLHGCKARQNFLYIRAE